MSQYNFGTINPEAKSGADLANDLNNWRDALHTCHRGSSRPSYAQSGMLWIDDSADPIWVAKFYDGTQDIPLLTFSSADGTTRNVWSKGPDIASAASITIPATGNYFDVTGTTTVTAISALPAGAVILLQFDAALTLTHNATSLILPGGANITTAAGDVAVFVSEGSGNWRCIDYRSNTTFLGRYFESAEYPVVAATGTTVPHDLGAKPKFVQMWLVCLVADVGFSVGDEVPVNTGSSSSSQSRSASIRVADASNIAVRIGSDAQSFVLPNRLSGNMQAITNSSWNWKIKAMA